METTDIARRLHDVKDGLPQGVQLVAVSKFHPADYIMAAYNAGQRIFGESREQELAKKVEALPKDIEWHFIGHLQTNKVKYIAPYISMIDAVDSMKLLREINKQCQPQPNHKSTARAAHCRGGNQIWTVSRRLQTAVGRGRMAKPYQC